MKAELRSGSKLGRYELLVELGKGGTASVWIAREPGDLGDRLVALKAMLPELARRPDFRTMFLEEGQVVRSIDHPNVVRVYEVSEDRGVLFMAMEWVRGDSLNTVMRDSRGKRPIPAEMAVRIIADTAAGLHAAHELRGWDGELRNLVHCDVSPHNILVGVDGRSRLVDFGVANGTAHGDPEKGDTVKGKFGYMSPEQANGEPIDRRTDVFALGIVLWELTTGERLFQGELPAHTLRLAQAARIPNPQRVLPDYPERLAPIVLKALEKDRRQRFQTAEELRAALEHFLREERLVVSHPAVGKHVAKVLRKRLEAQDEELREALVAKDGLVQGGLVPSAQPPSGGHHARPSDPSQRPSGNSSPFHRSSRHRRAPIGAVLFGVAGVMSAVSAIVWTSLQAKPNALVTAPGIVPANGAHAAGPANVVNPGVGAEAVSLDSIPLAADDPHGVRGASAPRPRRVTLEEEGEQREPPREPRRPTSAEKVQLDETQPAPAAPAKPAAHAANEPAKPVEAEEEPAPPPTPKPPPSDAERGPLNRGAALSALAAASGRATSCSNPEGPNGAGRAMVTFSPDGPVTGVSLAAPFAGTNVGTCVTNAFKTAHVPPFTGSAVTLPQSFRVP